MLRLLVVLLLSFSLSGCAVQLAKSEWCLRKKLEVEIPFGGGEFKPKPCRSKELFNKLF